MDKTMGVMKSKFKLAEREEEIITCYEIAGDLALLCLQLRDKRPSGPQPAAATTTYDPSSNFVVTSLIEMAISQVPVMYLKRG